MLSRFCEENTLTADKRTKMQKIMDALRLPRSIGRCRTKLATMSDFTAAELKSFTLLSLGCALFEEVKLDEDCRKIWENFAIATRHLSKAVVTLRDLEKGQTYLQKFANGLATRYRQMKPNVHRAFHIHEHILDYGPVYVYQVYACAGAQIKKNSIAIAF